jgi:hypothetical protein
MWYFLSFAVAITYNIISLQLINKTIITGFSRRISIASDICFKKTIKKISNRLVRTHF